MGRLATFLIALFSCTLIGPGTAFVETGTASGAEAGVSHIKRGDPQRKPILDAARTTFVEETGGPVEFVVRRLTMSGRWGYAFVMPQRPGGAPIDWSKTKYRQIHADGDLDGEGESHVLLVAHDGVWLVQDFAIGPTDVVWDGWRQEFNLPLGMFRD